MNSYSSGSYVAPSPAMSYLNMLAEKLDEPPRGVYYEGDQIGDWVLGKEIGHGSFSRVFEASHAAESVLSDMLSPLDASSRLKIVGQKNATMIRRLPSTCATIFRWLGTPATSPDWIPTVKLADFGPSNASTSKTNPHLWIQPKASQPAQTHPHLTPSFVSARYTTVHPKNSNPL
ncbi:hypothetical protein HDU77_005678 [Chytriomyces hyalinus]|nr:hypothetical protein HDU77_005678 [Chytriomyces hyalinus]